MSKPASYAAHGSRTGRSRIVKNLIDGLWRESDSDRTMRRENPANREQEVAVVPLSSRADVNAAVDAARRAAQEWASQPAVGRRRLVSRALELLQRRRDEIAVADVLESGKTLRECVSEVDRTIDTVQYQVESVDEASQIVFPERGSVHVSNRWSALGVVAVITPWNFPFSVLLRKVVPGLMMGNSIVAKPSELTPVTASVIGEAFLEAGLPSGVLNIVFGDGATGSNLVDHVGVDGISFTGSTGVGLGIQRAVGDRDVKVQLEMGGKNAMVVLPDANFEAAMRAAISASYTAAGQWCVATSRLIVEESMYARFVRAFVEKSSSLIVGDGLDDRTEVGPVVSKEQYGKILSYLGRIGSHGSETLEFDGGYHAKVPANGYFVKPTVVRVRDPLDELWQDEVFGPVVSVMPCKDLDEALYLTNATRYGLSASIFTSDHSAQQAFCERAQVGRVCVNLPTNAGDARVTGTGWSGSGRGEPEGAITGLRFFSRPKAVFIHA